MGIAFAFMLYGGDLSRVIQRFLIELSKRLAKDAVAIMDQICLGGGLTRAHSALSRFVAESAR
jgi:hypothetical protein